MRRANGRRESGRWNFPALAGGLLLALTICAIGARPTGTVQTGPGTLRNLLPADGEAPGWRCDGGIQEYAGEDLYTYIDGGAEIYQEYGFRRVVLQDYRNAAGTSVSIEIFEMEAPGSAFGIFTFKRSGKGKPVALGSGAELEDYYLNFWKGRYLITLTGFDETAETVDGLIALGGRVDAKIADAAAPPALIGVLPPQGLSPGSVKYFKGLLGLSNIYAFHSARGLSFVSGVKGDYESDTTLLVLDYGTIEGLDEAARELGASLAGSDRFKRSAGDPAKIETLVAVDGKGRFVAFGRSGPRLYVGIGPVKDAAVGIARPTAR